MIGRREREVNFEARWRAVLGVLVAAEDYEHRLDSLLAEVTTAAELPSAHLYLVDDSGRRFHLERSLGVPTDAGMLEGGAGSVGATPPLEVPRTPEDDEDHAVVSTAGRLWSLPLRVNSTLVGLVQTGPLDAREPPAHTRRRLDAIRFPLSVAVRQAREEHLLRQRVGAHAAREEVARRLQASAIDLERFVGLLLGLALRSTRTDAAFVAIVDGDGRLAIRAQQGMPPGFAESVDLSTETGLFDWSPAADGGALVLRDLDAAAQLGMRTLLAVPLLEHDEPLGIFALVNFGEGGTFDAHSLELLETFADQIKLMLHNARLFERFAGEYLETVKGLAHSLDARRESTHAHHKRVSDTAVAIARELGLDDSEVEAVRLAGLVHDVGLAGIVEADAFRADVDHPTVGAALIEHLPLHPAVAPAIASHHEWWDGWGFPLGLRGEAISPAGRALAAAEFLVELGTTDPVRAAWSPERLAAELEVRRGSQFEPTVADAAARVVNDIGREEE